MFILLQLFFHPLSFAKEIDFKISDIKVSDSLGGERRANEILDALKNGRYDLVRKDKEADWIKYNGAEVLYLATSRRKGFSIIRFNEEVVYKGIVLPPPVDVSFDIENPKTVSDLMSSSENESVKYKNFTFKRSTYIKLNEVGSLPLLGYSAANQNVDGIQCYINQPVVFDEKGSLRNVDAIKTHNRIFTFKNLKNDMEFNIMPDLLGTNKYGYWFEFKQKKGVIFAGNKCDNCLYTLCLKNDHFFVYRIQNIKPGDVIQGKVHKKKNVWGYFYENGESTKPYEDIKDDEDEPFADRCTFKSAHAEN